jgi:hypothetical protein
MTPPDEAPPSGADPIPADVPAAGEDRSGTQPRDWGALADTLTTELQQRIRDAGGDPARFEETWAALADAYGPRGAYNVVRLRAGQVLNLELDPDFSEKLAHLAQSRHNFLPHPQSGAAALPSLPHEGGEYRAAAGFEMPPQVRIRVEAASEAMRRALARVYENPVLAEARLHALAATDRNTASFAAELARNPEVIGALRPDLPSDGRDAALNPAIAHARVAYAFHFARTPDHAVDLASREAVAAVQRAAAEVERAARALDRAVDLHGPALNAHLQELREGIVRGPGPSRDPGRGGRGERGEPEHDERSVEPDRSAGPQSSGPALPPDARVAAPAPVRDVPAPAPVADPAVEEAFRVNQILEEARFLEKRGAELRAERGHAQSILAVLDFDDHEQLRTRRDVDALAGKVYRHPERAVERWNDLVSRLDGDTERARKIVAANPGRLGAMNSEPAGWLARLPLPGWVTDNLPFRSTGEAREQVPHFADKAVAYSKAREQAQSRVEWTSPTGKQMQDRAEIRAAAREVEKGLATEIARNDAALFARGNVPGAEREAERAVSSLRPEQRSVLARRLAEARGVPAAEMTAALSRLATAPRLALQGARALRAAGEGPGQSL